MDGYNIFRTDRCAKGGGVAIYIKNTFQATVQLSKSVPKQFELLILKVESTKSCVISVAGCYRPPSASKDTLSSLSDCLSSIKYNELVLMGDLNWDWLTPASDSFKCFCDSALLTQIIDSPTRPNNKHPEKSTLLDLILTNVPQKYKAIAVFANDVSDHCIIACVRDTKLPKCKPRIILKRNFKLFCEQAFLNDLYLCDWTKINLIPEPEIALQYFKSLLLDIINKHAPLRKHKIKGRDNPWFSEQLSELIHERDLAWATARKSKNKSDWQHFRYLRNKCVSQIRKAKADFYVNEICDSTNNPSKFWKMIKSLSSGTRDTVLPNTLKLNDEIITEKKSMLDSLNQHFISSGLLFEQEMKQDMSQVDYSLSGENVLCDFDLALIAKEEVYNALIKLNTKKSSGPDGLDPYFLKIAAEHIAEPLTYIFNLTIETGIIPSVWKSAYVTPLLKGGDRSNPNNYRPISKLSALAKVLEGLISDQLKDFLTANSILNELQSGFRKKHSTVTATMKVLNDLISDIDSKEYCAALFLDLSKAFDTVDHLVLCQRLRDIGMSSKAVMWFGNYLSGRTQSVQVDGVSSKPLLTQNGVPQGSILGPILFTIYINVLCQNVNDAKFHFYADDTILYCSASSLTSAIQKLQSAFNVVQSNLNQLRLVLNSDKTKLMCFSKSRKTDDACQIVIQNEKVIERVSVYKYLGFYLDENLSFKYHIECLTKKLRVKLGFYYRNKSCFSFNARKRLIQATFVSILDYGDILYMHANLSSLKMLDSVYHAALRFVTDLGFRTHHCSLYESVGWPSLYNRRWEHWYCFLYKAVLCDLPPYLCSLLVPKVNTRSCRLRHDRLKMYTIPRTRTVFGESAFKAFAPSSWYKLQSHLNLDYLPSMEDFKARIKDYLTTECTCSLTERSW